MLGQITFIVWRESIEALLVVGILFAWLRQHPEAESGRKYLWLGVGLGLLAALGLGAALLGFAELFDGERQDYFQIGMMSVAALLIVQMVFWMRRHGRTLKRDLEQGLNQRAHSENWWGMVMLVALAIAREGSESVVFLYGMGAAQSGLQWFSFALSALVGLALAFLTFYALQAGGKYFSWKTFFRVTEAMLLLLAAGLVVNTLERMVGLGWLPPLLQPVWDSSAVLDESGTVGGVVAALTGYRSHPALMILLGVALYWSAVVFQLKRISQPAAR